MRVLVAIEEVVAPLPEEPVLIADGDKMVIAIAAQIEWQRSR